MTDEAETIIEEYLALVREKLPEDIAEDVINELRSYMLETAKDQGNGEISIQTAKKVVAQFGAPGEVADEYKYSMMPETIPEEVKEIQKEAIEKPRIEMPQQETIELIDRPRLTPITGGDPTVSYASFFVSTTILAWIWMVLSCLLGIAIGPLWYPIWLVFFPIAEAIIITIVLLFLTIVSSQKKNKLWRRAYNEWSGFHNIVTLPENAIPESSNILVTLDVLVMFIGLLIFVPTTIFNGHPFFTIFNGAPISILIALRIYYQIGTITTKEDPLKSARKEFVVNFALLTVLNASFYWIFNLGPWVSMTLWSMSPIICVFNILYGSVVLFSVLTGAQNLWFETQQSGIHHETKKDELLPKEKKELLRMIPKTAEKSLIKTVLWLLLYNIPVLYLSMNISAPFVFYQVETRFAFFAIEALLVVLVTLLYFGYRYFMINSMNSKMVTGQRTRGEAIIDLLASIIILLGVVFFLQIYVSHLILFGYTYYVIELGEQIAYQLAVMETAPILLFIVGLSLRTWGNILEFKTKWKIKAAQRLRESGILLLVGLSIIVASEYFRFLLLGGYMVFEILAIPIAIFLILQIETSSLRLSGIKKLKEKNQPTKPQEAHSSIAN